MTGGGSQDDAQGKDFNWGGNVNPGCHADQGNWNHIDRRLNVHFQGRDIHVVRCGNVEGIPPGSRSPKTPFNFIEFTGPGRIKGKSGDGGWQDVFFFARVEDRAEPGSNGQPNVNARDRYFLHVYSNPSDPAGSTVLLVDQDGNPNTADGVIIDQGNLQLHIIPCPNRGVTTSNQAGGEMRVGGLTRADDGVWLAAPGPNPARDWTTLTFRIPRDSYVSLKVLDVTGREVRELVSGDFSAGEHTTLWDLSDNNLNPVSGGVFFLRLAVGNKVYSRPLAVIH
jgi:hypothetical protein